MSSIQPITALPREQTVLSLREKLNGGGAEGVAESPGPRPTADAYQALKERIHLKLLDRFDLAAMEALAPERLRDEIAAMVERLLLEEQAVINEAERAALVRDIQHEMLGLGPLEPLLADPTISDILVNTYSQVYVERHGRLELTDVTLHGRRST